MSGTIAFDLLAVDTIRLTTMADSVAFYANAAIDSVLVVQWRPLPLPPKPISVVWWQARETWGMIPYALVALFCAAIVVWRIRDRGEE